MADQLNASLNLDDPFWEDVPDAARFEARIDQRLVAARAALDRLIAIKGDRTIANTLCPYDELLRHLDAALFQTDLILNVHPEEAFRAIAEKSHQRAAAFANALSLNHDVYVALAAIELGDVDAETRFYVQKTLRDFRLAGVDKPEPIRRQITALRDELVKIGQEFSRNIRHDLRTVTVTDTAELDGLPADFIARHQPDGHGHVTLTIDYPDALPVFAYAKSEALRKRMYLEYNNRAYPENIDILNRLLARRHELATMLGFACWADYITADKMAGSARTAKEFIDRIFQASRTRAETDYCQLLERKRRDEPAADVVNAWESNYYAEQVRQSEFEFDSQSVRPYFGYMRVKQGVLDVTAALFGVRFERAPKAPVWHESVECWQMYDADELVGRFFLDMHPRANKYNHAAHFGIRTGVAGRQIPEAALVCNFPGGIAGDPGLMTHDEVVTFFHEFGHLIHSLLAGRHRWIGIGGISTEQDFVEAPSQMLEEWAWDAGTLATFARHHDTDAPISAELVRQMKLAKEFGKGLHVRRQMLYARLSLLIHESDPAEIDTDEIVKELVMQYMPFPFVEGTHFQTAFGHLDGYSAMYYTYMWSLVIAKDLFSKFDRSQMLVPAVARHYGEVVLAPGGSRPAAQLVEEFLGRPFNFAAYQAWLDAGSE